MKIVMLGHSGVGKTTYMASMYGALQQQVHGFGLQARNKEVHDALLGSAQSITDGTYPLPTDQRSKYKFRLTFNGKAFFSFTWVDYRGGALLETSASSQSRKLVQDLTQADGIMVFCDSEALARRGSVQVGRMMTLIAQAIDRLDHPLPLVVILTKADLVAERNGYVPEVLVGLRDAVAASEKVFGTFIRVACGSNSFGVEKPVLFALHRGILSQAFALKYQVAAHLVRMNSYRHKIGIINELWTSFTGKKSYSELVAQEHRNAKKLWGELEPLIAPADALGEYLDDLTVF